MFDLQDPFSTDPVLSTQPKEYIWGKSLEENVYYAWVQTIASEVSFHATLEPLCKQLRNGVELWCYYGLLRQELLYRIKFKDPPTRLVIFPSPYCLFWSYGDSGGSSESVIYHYKDKFVTLHEWEDKNSFLAILRQYLYAHPESTTFWSR